MIFNSPVSVLLLVPSVLPWYPWVFKCFWLAPLLSDYIFFKLFLSYLIEMKEQSDPKWEDEKCYSSAQYSTNILWKVNGWEVLFQCSLLHKHPLKDDDEICYSSAQYSTNILWTMNCWEVLFQWKVNGWEVLFQCLILHQHPLKDYDEICYSSAQYSTNILWK